MNDATHRVWTPGGWLDLPVPSMAGEPLVVPNVNALLYRDTTQREVLLQRRDKEGEVVRGRWELPGGRWRAGEQATAALAREIEEETGIVVTAVEAAAELRAYHDDVVFEISRPLAVVAGVSGSYPSIHVLFACIGNGEPRPQRGETSMPTWWPVSELMSAVRDDPEAFVWHTRAMLAAVYGDA